jgi:putative transposase
MPHTYSKILVHVVFSTKERRPWLKEALQAKAWAYIGGIARKNQMRALAVGGIADHVHCLLHHPPAMATSKAVQLIKGGSSKWIHDTFPELKAFAWQEGFFGFTVSISQVDKVVAYIANQAEHHKKRDYKAELLSLLKKHGVEYDERYLFD